MCRASRLDAEQPNDAVAQPQCSAIHYGDLCGLDAQHFCWRGRHGAPVRQHRKGNAASNRRHGDKNQGKPLDLGLGQPGTKYPSRLADRQSWSSPVPGSPDADAA
jgi:hypothetical protein